MTITMTDVLSILRKVAGMVSILFNFEKYKEQR